MRYRLLCGMLCFPLLLSSGADQKPSVEELLAKAKKEFFARDFVAAADSYRNATQLDATQTGAHVGLIRTLLHSQQVSEARIAANHALEVAGEKGSLLAARGEVAFREGDFQSAHNDFAKAIQVDPACARGWYGGAMLLITEFRPRTAKGFLRKAYEMDPGDPEIAVAWASTFEDVKERIAGLEKYIREASFEEPETLERIKSFTLAQKALGNAEEFQPADAGRPYSIKLNSLRIPGSGVTGYHLPVRINGSKPLRMLLDTGASGILLKKGQAEKLGVSLLVSSPVHGVGDEKPSEGFVGAVSKIQIGDLELRNCPIQVLKTNVLDGLDGVIGADVFSGFLFTFDPPGQKVELAPFPNGEQNVSWYWDRERGPPQGPDFWPVRMFGHLLLIEGRANNQRASFLLDSGAMVNSISTAFAESIGQTRGAAVQVMGFSGKTKNAAAAVNVTLEFARFRQTTGAMLAFDTSSLSRDLGTEVSGILGMDIFWQLTVKIDYRNGYVSFLKRSK